MMKLQLVQVCHYLKMKTLNIFGKTYRVKYIESTNMDNLLYADGITLIVNQQQLMDRIVNEYRNHNDENLIITPNQVQTAVEFNVLKEKDKLNHRIKKIGVQHDIEFQVKTKSIDVETSQLKFSFCWKCCISSFIDRYISYDVL